MKSLKSTLCASLLMVALSSTALAGNIHGMKANGNIHGATANGNIHGATANGNIHGVTAKGNIHGMTASGDILSTRITTYNFILGFLAAIAW